MKVDNSQTCPWRKNKKPKKESLPLIKTNQGKYNWIWRQWINLKRFCESWQLSLNALQPISSQVESLMYSCWFRQLKIETGKMQPTINFSSIAYRQIVYIGSNKSLILKCTFSFSVIVLPQGWITSTELPNLVALKVTESLDI